MKRPFLSYLFTWHNDAESNLDLATVRHQQTRATFLAALFLCLRVLHFCEANCKDADEMHNSEGSMELKPRPQLPIDIQKSHVPYLSHFQPIHCHWRIYSRR